MQSHFTNATPPGKLVLNVDKLNELRRAHELQSDSDFARFLGIERSTLYRVTNGQAAPSNGFMARMKLAFPSVSLDSLFTVDRLVAV
ncbi:hypothetical protein HUN59_14670 [Curtobacterium sp. Csp2]|uniref:hypothetical protein n=1 Tax=Curtobacterium sp. Csp2 TaxID=2495430 RepID=UPI00158109FA|nr:hypothetical protein [Curtobacterium sp. Csp2]QKS17284.1 hypothetical protein HUN59_14670 [Curtobacterium sp. Csp2]